LDDFLCHSYHLLTDELYHVHDYEVIMESFERKERTAELLLLYGKMMTETVYRRMAYFYLEDYSIGEIAQNEGVSRNAVFESLRAGEKLLDEWEDKLGFYQKNNKINHMLDELSTADKERQKELIQAIKGEISYGI
jgi:predicted DNA-binding protein YlxM (UPF0122 family)